MIVTDPVKAVGVKIISFVDSASANARVETTVSQSNIAANAITSPDVLVESNSSLTATSSVQNFQAVHPLSTLKNQSLDQTTDITTPFVISNASIFQSSPGMTQPPSSATQQPPVSWSQLSFITGLQKLTDTATLLAQSSATSAATSIPVITSLQVAAGAGGAKQVLPAMSSVSCSSVKSSVPTTVQIVPFTTVSAGQITTATVSHMDNSLINEHQASQLLTLQCCASQFDFRLSIISPSIQQPAIAVKDAPPIVIAVSNSTSSPSFNPSQTVNASATVLHHVARGESRTTLEKLESELCKVSGVNPPNNIPSVTNSGSV
ncbi:unnamed protein product, partial [Wuchereria bancrofti]